MATQIVALYLTPTFECIGVRCKFSGDANQNAIATLEYRPSGSTYWIPTTEMRVDRRAAVISQGSTIANPYANEWRASIVGLRRDTEYEVMVTIQDPDGVVGSPISGPIRTWSHDETQGLGPTYYVAPGASGGDGSLSRPWSLAYAEGRAQPGDSYLLLPGEYGSQTFIRSGVAGNPITYAPQNLANPPTFSGQITLNCRHVRLKGFRHPSGGTLIQNATWNILEAFEQSRRGITLQGEVTGTLIQDCYIHDITENPPNGFERAGIYRRQGTIGGVVIRRNNIARCWDGVGGEANFAIDGGYPDSDIHKNPIERASDDGIEAEGSGLNTRIWGNTIINCGNADLGLASIIIGPTYVFRNLAVVTDPAIGQNGYKLGGNQSKGHLLIYHNTSYYTTGRQGFTDAGGKSAGNIGNISSRNNIVQARNRVIASWGTPSSFDNTVSFDYDNLYKPTGGYQDSYAVWDGGYYNFAQFRAGKPSQEVHGMSVDSQFVDPASSNFQLRETSPLVDAGQVILGFNDPDSAWPYVGSAPDIGAFELGVYVPPTPTPVLLTLEVAGNGTTDPPSGNYEYPRDSAVTLTAIPTAHHKFAGWTGSIVSLENPLMVTLTGDLSIVANFTSIIFIVAIAAEPGGSTDPASGSYQHQEGSQVTVIALPSAGYYFVEWQEGGLPIGTGNPLVFVVDADRSITAVFALISIPPGQFGVSITVLGQGTTTPVPGTYTVVENSPLTVVAAPVQGWRFAGWQGDVSGTNPSITVQVTRDLSIVAVFTEQPPSVSVGKILAGAALFATLVAMLRRH